MKNVIFATVALLAFSLSLVVDASELDVPNRKSVKRVCSNKTSFFPVFGFSLGKTKAEELAKLGSRNKEYDHYYIHGQKFWVSLDDHDAYYGEVFDHMYISRPKEVPTHWRNMGFSWYLTYEQIYNLFECLGFNLEVTEEPRVVDYKGYNTLNAKLTATKQSENLKVILKFKFGRRGAKVNSENTLYSIKLGRLDKPNKSFQQDK